MIEGRRYTPDTIDDLIKWGAPVTESSSLQTFCRLQIGTTYIPVRDGHYIVKITTTTATAWDTVSPQVHDLLMKVNDAELMRQDNEAKQMIGVLVSTGGITARDIATVEPYRAEDIEGVRARITLHDGRRISTPLATFRGYPLGVKGKTP